MPRGPQTIHRTSAERAALLASLPHELRNCGHVGPAAQDYYNLPASKRAGGNICVSCYRERERERQRAYRGGATVTPLHRAGHVGRPSNDPEVAYALGVLRDARAQRAGKQGYVYCIGERGRDLGVKIGYSVNPTARVAELQTGNPRELVLLGAFQGTEADERDLHERYFGDNLVGEWFRPSPALLSEFDIESEEVSAA